MEMKKIVGIAGVAVLSVAPALATYTQRYNASDMSKAVIDVAVEGVNTSYDFTSIFVLLALAIGFMAGLKMLKK